MRDYFNTGYNMAQYVFAYILLIVLIGSVVVGELEFLEMPHGQREAERSMPEPRGEACNDLKRKAAFRFSGVGAYLDPEVPYCKTCRKIIVAIVPRSSQVEGKAERVVLLKLRDKGFEVDAG